MNARRQWGESELGWFTKVKEFESEPWWEERNADGTRIPGSFDEKNAELVRKIDGRTTNRPFPFFWEVLRRHPDFPELKTKFSCVLPGRNEPADSVVFDEWEERWRNAGAEAIYVLLKSGHKTWPDLSRVYRPLFERGGA